MLGVLLLDPAWIEGGRGAAVGLDPATGMAGAAVGGAGSENRRRRRSVKSVWRARIKQFWRNADWMLRRFC